MTEPNLADPTTTPPATTPTVEAPAQAPETDWKAEARKWEQRAKENTQKVQELQPLADQFRQLDEASKSEMQRMQEALEATSRERDTTAAEATRLRVALKHGITEDDFDLLGSGTEEQISARAERIAAKNKAVAEAASVAAQQTAPPPARTVEDLRPGATPAQPGDVVESEYPSSWLTPRQRERIEKRRPQERSTT